MALLVALVAGGTVATVQWLGHRLIDNAAQTTLGNAFATQDRLGRERLRGLEFAAGVIANDPGIAPYLSASIGDDLGLGDASAPDLASLRDLLSERRQQFVFDLGLLLDPRGGVLARSDRGEAFVQNLSADPLVAAALEKLTPQGGYWRFEGQLFQASIVPMTQDGGLIGFMLLAQRIDDALSRDLATTSGADVAFWIPGKPGPKLLASSLPAERAQALAAALADDPTLRATAPGGSGGVYEFRLGEEAVLAKGGRLALLGGQPAIATTLLPENAAHGDARRLLQLLTLASAGAAAIGLLLAALLARWALTPLGALANTGERMIAGELDLDPALPGGDPLARLSRTLGELLSRLREKRDMDSYMSDLNRHVAEEDAASAARATQQMTALSAALTSTTQIGDDLRQPMLVAADGGEIDPAATLHQARAVSPAATAPQTPSATPPPQAPIATSSAPAELAVGSRLGSRYEILSILGKGGMGMVYKVRDLELGDIVALKLLRSGALEDREQIERLKDEIRLARRITHPNVVRTFDFGESEGRAFITMEYVHGVVLRTLLKQTARLPYSAALRIARQLAAGLEAAHTVGVLHRDIKPENLIVEAGGDTKLMDFGIARPARRRGEGLTQVGMTVGSPDYSAPEQLTGSDVDERADIYSCGVVLCELVSGARPYRGGSAVEIYMAQMNQTPYRPSQAWPDLPAEFEQIALRCIAIQPEQRYRNASELGQALAKLKA